jgi:hypothetical protein
MARKIITVTIGSSTTATGPYNVYTTSISDDNLLESNVSLANMKTGRTYRVNTDISQVVITNENNDCCCSIKNIIIDAAPTPSPTTAAPTTASPTTSSPTTASPTTSAPTTAAPTTSSPTTASPTTASPTTAAPTTTAPTTAAPTTASPTTAAPTTAAPTGTGIFTVKNTSGSGQIDDVTTTGGAYFYFFNTGSFPLTPGQEGVGGGAALTNSPVIVTISNYSSTSCLSLYINGSLNGQLEVSGNGTYTFTNKTFAASDTVLIEYVSGICP